MAQDLLTLEVNTVVKDNMTARKMPPIPIALLEIAAEYYWYIIELNEHWRAPKVEARLRGLEPENWRNSPETFDALRETSTLLMQTMRQAPTAAAVRVSPPQLSVIRKTWDIGTATIALQSAMQMDGDIVTSIQKSYAGAEFKALHDMHLNGTRLSIETWATVAHLVIDIVSGVASSFSRLLRGR